MSERSEVSQRRAPVRAGGSVLGLAAAIAAMAAPLWVHAAATTAIDGLWQYEAIARDGGVTVPIDGLFLFSGGRFVQHSLNRGEPLASQLAQGHSGPFSLTPAGELVMTATVGFLLEPDGSGTRLVDRRREHQAMARVAGDRLTLTFDSGTVQTLSRVSSSEPRIMWLEGGAFATVEKRFLLVHADSTRVVTASGRATPNGDRVALEAERWVTLLDGRAEYARDRNVTIAISAGRLDVPGYGAIRIETTPR